MLNPLWLYFIGFVALGAVWLSRSFFRKKILDLKDLIEEEKLSYFLQTLGLFEVMFGAIGAVLLVLALLLTFDIQISLGMFGI